MPLLPYGDKMEQFLQKRVLRKRTNLKMCILDFVQSLQKFTFIYRLQLPFYRKVEFGGYSQNGHRI
jgi:hypothetical protein